MRRYFTRLGRASAFTVFTLALFGCGESSTTARPPAAGTAPSPSPAAEAEAMPEGADEEAPTDPALAKMIRRTLMEVAGERELVVKREVAGRRLNRAEVLERIMAKTKRDLPEGLLEAQGDLLRAFGLLPADYRFVDGIYELIQRNVAGFYDEDLDTMFLLDDLGAADRETLVHELQHALQDQHFDLGKLIDYTPGDSDRVTATHALAEGDAMSTMFDVTLGDAFMMDPGALRFAMVASVAMMEGGQATPRVLQASLIAPYVDGFRFVQTLRQRGGWHAVNEAFRKPPTSTEQLLHLDKFDAREAPVKVPKPPLPPGSGWKESDSDVLGEQGLRMILEQWGRVDDAQKAAAGWGGDRYMVAKRDRDDGEVAVAVAWLLAFDDEAEADQAARFLKQQHPVVCAENDDRGPFAWKRRGSRLAVVAGPFLKKDGAAQKSLGDCTTATAWVDATLATQ